MRIPALILATTFLAAAPVRAGLFDMIKLPTGRAAIPAEAATQRVNEYLRDVLGVQDFKVTNGRGDFTGAEKKALDRHLTSRLDRAGQIVIADVAGPRGKGVLVIAGGDLASPLDPKKGYLAYLSLDTDLVFPEDADRALSLMAHVIGEPALFGFAPEGGPLWKVTERYLSRGYAPGGGMPGQAGQFTSSDGAVEAYAIRKDEPSPEQDEIPAWVVRGLHDLAWKKEKPLEMGVLIALTRRPGTRVCRLTHVTGVGTLGKTLFKDFKRLATETEE